MSIVDTVPDTWREHIHIDMDDIAARVQAALAAITPRDGGEEVYFASDHNDDSAMNGEVMTQDGSECAPESAKDEAINLLVLALVAEQFPGA